MPDFFFTPSDSYLPDKDIRHLTKNLFFLTLVTYLMDSYSSDY